MRHQLALTSILFFTVACGGGSSTPNAGLAPRTEIEGMVDELVAETDWDLSGNLAWGFHFLNATKPPLEILGSRLKGEGYRVISLSENPSGKGKNRYELHVEKIEYHNLPSLSKRSDELKLVATELGIDHFDGVEVAPIAGSSVGYEQIWWTYLADYKGKPGAVSLNLALRDRAPFEDYPTLLVTGIKYDIADGEDGLPSETELEKIHQIRTERITQIKLNTSAIEAGGLILDGEELHYIYLKDSTGVENMLRDFYEKVVPGRETRVTIKANTDWEAYFDLLFPNSETLDFYQQELKNLDLWRWVSDENKGAE